MKLQDCRGVIEAVNGACSCGGNGPGDGCPACEVWHAIADFEFADDPKPQPREPSPELAEAEVWLRSPTTDRAPVIRRRTLAIAAELDRLRACELALLRLREIYATSTGSDGCGTIGGDLCAEWNALLEGGAAKSQPASAQDGDRAEHEYWYIGESAKQVKADVFRDEGDSGYATRSDAEVSAGEDQHVYRCLTVFERVEPTAAQAAKGEG